MEKLKKLKVDISLEVPFWVEDTSKSSKSAIRQIKRYVREVISEELSFIPYYDKVPKYDEEVECATKQTKIRKCEVTLLEKKKRGKHIGF